jgi:hypothetical protein
MRSTFWFAPEAKRAGTLRITLTRCAFALGWTLVPSPQLLVGGGWRRLGLLLGRRWWSIR